MMDFRDELRQALTHLPVKAGDALPLPPEDASEEEWEAFRLSRTPKVVEPVDNVGEEVRILTLEEAVPEIVAMMEEKGTFEDRVWEEIWETRAKYGHTYTESYLPLKPVEKEAQVLRHLTIKCPDPANRAVWAVYREGKLAHARVFDRPHYKTDEVWVQWIVGVKAVGKPSLRVAQVLYDVGVRRICWKALPDHALHLHWEKYPQFVKVIPPAPEHDEGLKHYRGGLLHGRYVEYCFMMTERPERWEDYLR